LGDCRDHPALGVAMTNDAEIRKAYAAIVGAIAELRSLNVPVPMALHLAAYALHSAVASRPEDLPACNGQGHSGVI
jgi:hypothetical protein